MNWKECGRVGDFPNLMIQRDTWLQGMRKAMKTNVALSRIRNRDLLNPQQVCQPYDRCFMLYPQKIIYKMRIMFEMLIYV
jgi:hypothetical protein